ncbi:hypothetical protein ABMY47_21990, partial [Pseudoalteromonas sp. BZP1]|uniref:hypothetical protein n=1 Tax=Pseudoalteromonas sp. BZP1 TaxID=3136671 RepID=UPI0032C40F32
EGFLGDIDIKLNTTEKELLSVYPGLEYGFFETDTQFHENYRFFLHSVEDYVYGIEYVYEDNTPYTLGEVKRLFGEPDENYENWQQNNLLHIYHSGENWLVYKTEGFTWDNDMPLKAVMVRPEGNFD